MSLKKASSSLVSRSRVGFTPTGGGAAVTISNVIVTDSSWNNLDDTAVGTSSSYIKIIGSGFVVNPSVYIGTTQVSSGSITFVSSTELRVVLPSLSLGTQNLFVFNTDYSGAIWSAGLVVSGFPDYTQTTYTSSTPLSVSVQLLATGDAPLTYALQGGSSLPAGTSLSSSGLITGTTTDGTYQFTVIVSDAQNQSFQQQLTLTITSTDQYFNRTVLAINGDINTFVSDGSTNNSPITINGDTKPSKFSPYNTNWSVYIDGTDYLEVTQNASLAFQGGGAWTWESFVYPITGGIVYSSYTGPSNSGGSFIFSVGTSIGFSWILNGTDTWSFDSGSTGSTANSVQLNAWSHCAVSYDGAGSLKFFVNGTLNATFSRTVNVDTLVYNIRVGRSMHPSFPSQFGGYLSNMRFVKGTALYTSSFTAPTSALTAVANTVFLGFTSNRMTYDASSVNNTITPFNTPQTTSFGPFTETDTTTGSGYFDGSGDYLTLPSDAALNLGTGAFSVEFWVYITSLAENPTFINTNGTLIFYEVTGSNRGLCAFANSAAQLTSSTTALPLNAWNHVVVCRNSSGNLSSFVNGIRLATVASNTSTFDFSGGIVNRYFPSSSGHLFGYTSSLRIVKGSTPYDPTQSTLTVPSASLTAIANTSLLTLQTRQPVNNHTFIDVSGNNNLITRNGNPTQGSFSPFSPAGWSNYFDGSGDYLSTPASSHNAIMGASSLTSTLSFTIECWIYMTAAPTSAQYGGVIGDMNPTGPADYWSFGPLNNNFLSFYWYDGSPRLATGNTTISLNSWTHIAVSSNSGALKLFVNGVQQTITGTSTLSNTTGSLGALTLGQFNSSTVVFTGYISNLRIVKQALYSTTFTPSTTPLTAIANTSLLTCQSNRFIDNSTNNFTITRNGDTKVVNFSPFAPTAAYSLATHGGSAYFDGGTGDYLQCATGIAIPSTGTFTIECWVYITVSSVQILVSQYTNTDPNRSTFSIDSTLNFNPVGIAGSTVVPLNQWNHCAVTRDSSNTLRIFLNGKVDATSANYTSAIQQIQTRISGFANTPTYVLNNAYISGLRITNTAVYTSEFTPPTAPVSSNSNTTLNLPFNNAAIVDVSSRNVMETVGDAKIVTSTRKYGTGSMYFDGTGDYLIMRPDPLFAFGTGDFTLEFWLYPVVAPTLFYAIYDVRPASSQGAYPFIYFNNDRTLRFWVNTADRITSSALSLNTWYHVAVSRSGTSTKMFLDGVQTGSTYTDTTTYIASNPIIGASYSGGASIANFFNGYIDDLRITKFARYTANFTPPTATFLAQ